MPGKNKGHYVALACIDKEYSSQSSFSIQRDKVRLTAGKADLPFYQGTARVSILDQ